jgi:hypothetical protein
VCIMDILFYRLASWGGSYKNNGYLTVNHLQNNMSIF